MNSGQRRMIVSMMLQPTDRRQILRRSKLILKLACALLLFSLQPVHAQSPVENVVLITLDGLRGEEVFGGADPRLFLADLGVKSPDEHQRMYGGETPEERREKLLPFLWKQMESQGWIAGDVSQDSHVRVTNGKYFSYPGYNEILSGFADDAIDSNAKQYNSNTTVLEWLNAPERLDGSVAAFCSWDVFPFIINDRRSGIPVNAGWMDLTVGPSARTSALNRVANNLFHEWDGVRYDVFTTEGALAAMRTTQPKLLYVALGETDDWAHAGRYDRYLLTARQNDGFIRDLWEAAEELEHYRGNTVFIVATDHGRGDGREGWKSHSSQLPGSERIWIAAFGAGLTARGIDVRGSFEQAQVAATVAKFLGYDFNAHEPRAAKPLPIGDW